MAKHKDNLDFVTTSLWCALNTPPLADQDLACKAMHLHTPPLANINYVTHSVPFSDVIKATHDSLVPPPLPSQHPGHLQYQEIIVCCGYLFQLLCQLCVVDY